MSFQGSVGLEPEASMLSSLVDDMVRIEYNDGKYEVSLLGRIVSVTKSFALVSYRRCDRTLRVSQVGKRAWRPRSEGVAREVFLLSDIRSGAIKLTPEKTDTTRSEASYGRGRDS